MGTRRRDAQRRQVSLAVEALEDRFLLSGAASLSIPAATNGPPALFTPAHIRAAENETRPASPQEIPGHSVAWQSSTFPLHPMMSYRGDDDGDRDAPDIADKGNSDNAFFAYPLLCSTENHAAGCIDFVLPASTPQQMALPTASVMSFLPLLSASGLSVASTTQLPTLLPAIASSENAPANLKPTPGMEEMRPMPAVPETLPSDHPPLIEEPAGPPPSSPGGPFAELLPIDAEAIRCGVDIFFQQLNDLSEEWRDGRVLEKLAPWLLAASAAGYGWIRLRDRRNHSLADLLDSDRPESVPTLFLPGGKR